MTNIQDLSQKSKKAYVSWLEAQEWTFFITGSTRYELTLKSLRRLMERWFEVVKTDGSRLFWAGEKFELKDGYHGHGLLYIPNDRLEIDPDNIFLFQRLVDAWQLMTGNKAVANHNGKIEWSKEGWNALHLKRFEKKRGGGGYCSKYVFKEGADYDLLC